MKQTFKDLEALFADKAFMKKTFIYVLVLIFQFIAMFVIAAIFDLETGNSLYALIALSIFVLTMAIFLIKILREYEDKHPILKVLWLAVCIIIPGLLFAWYDFLFNT